MRQLLPIFILLLCHAASGQSSLLNTALLWLKKTDRQTMDSYLNASGYRLTGEQDSLHFHQGTYSLPKTENGTQRFIDFILSDSILEFISFDSYTHQEQQATLSGLKSGRFQLIGTTINGNFITSTYDNGTILVQQDYEAIPNPSGKGEIPYYRFRVFRKYGTFDALNGEKIRVAPDGTTIRESLKNGLPDGERTYYYPNGALKRKENYRAGRLNGLASDYSPDGKMIHSSTHSYHWKYGMEKWYNSEGKTVRSLQWQRDLPVGTEKHTFNGEVIGSVSYVKGMKQGPAKVPVYYDPEIRANYPRDSLNDAPFGIEYVNYQNGVKAGRAICMEFHSPDTLYTAYYRAGKLDSVYTRYSENRSYYTTVYSDGLENGSRIYRIPSGPLKDTVYRVEPYRNGKLHGLAVETYQQETGEVFSDPDPGSHVSGYASSYPQYQSGKWVPVYFSETVENGIKNGPYVYFRDSLNYSKGLFRNGEADGLQESCTLIDGQIVKKTEHYTLGQKDGEFITDYPESGIRVTEHYHQNQKEGNETRTVNGKPVEERFFRDGILLHLKRFGENGDYESFDAVESESLDSVTIAYGKQAGDTSLLTCYSFSLADFAEEDTLLLKLSRLLTKNPEEMNLKRQGPFMIVTPFYEIYGNYGAGKLVGKIEITHFRADVFEDLFYQNGFLINSHYTQIVNCEDEPYTGTFISDITSERISVKNGLRHGWLIEYDPSGKEVRRTKYKNGISKKTEERN